MGKKIIDICFCHDCLYQNWLQTRWKAGAATAKSAATVAATTDAQVCVHVCVCVYVCMCVCVCV